MLECRSVVTFTQQGLETFNDLTTKYFHGMPLTIVVYVRRTFNDIRSYDDKFIT